MTTQILRDAINYGCKTSGQAKRYEKIKQWEHDAEMRRQAATTRREEEAAWQNR